MNHRSHGQQADDAANFDFSAKSEEASVSPGLPATIAQRRLWFVESGDVQSSTYNVPAVFTLAGPLDDEALERALDFMQDRHPALRSRFNTNDGELEIALAPERSPLTRKDLRSLGAEEKKAAVAQLCASHANHVFALEREAPIRCVLLRLGENEHTLLINIHHIVLDDWSIRIFFKELGVAYNAIRNGDAPQLPPVDYAAAVTAAGVQSESRLAKTRKYWKSQMAGAPTLHKLPTDRPRPAEQRMRGAVRRHVFGRPVMDGIRALCKKEGVTPYMLGVTAFAALLHRYSGEDQIVIGSPFANRIAQEQQNLIGFFINLIPIRVNFDGQPSFRTLLHQVRETLLDSFESAILPFDQIVEVVRPPRSMSHAPLFQIMFDYLKGSGDMLSLDGLDVGGSLSHTGTAKYDLTVSMEETASELSAIVEYDTDLFGESTVTRMMSHFERLIEAMVAAPTASIAEGSLLSGAELEAVRRFTRPDEPYDHIPYSPIPQRFRDAVKKTPHAEAIVCDDVRLTYEALDARSDALARALRLAGVTKGSRVASLLTYSEKLIISYLGILKAGAVYLPLDPADPRCAEKIDDAAPAIIVSTERDRSRLSGHVTVDTLLIDEAIENAAHGQAALDIVDLVESDPAYVIYTSGSTGKPKGVEVSHGSLNTSFHGWYRAYRFGKAGHPVTLQLAGMTFDLFIGDVSRTLACGGKLVMPPRQWLLDAAKLHEVMVAEGVSLGDFPPVILRELIRYCHETGARLDMLDTLLCGADIWFGHELYASRALCRPDARVLGSYGVTEAAIDSSYFDPDLHRLAPGSVVPLGRPLPSCDLYIVDSLLQMTPIGVPGELLVAGPAVATGYIGNDALTAEKFLTGHVDARGRLIVGEGSTRFYRTGDICRFLDDGTIDFLGRRDGQIKIRGFRVELGEVESVLAAHSNVRQCAIVVREDASGDPMLAAFAVSDASTAEELRGYLRGHLAAHMVPAAIELLDALPLTPSGKVDRNLLKTWQLSTSIDVDQPATTDVEHRLLALWQDLLPTNVPGIHENFFLCGGHSIAAARLVSRINQSFGIELSISSVFNHPTVAEQARLVEQRAASKGAGTVAATSSSLEVPASSGDIGLLSYSQQSLWLQSKRQPDDFSYNIPMVWRLDGALDPAVLEQAINDVVTRHEALRAVFSPDIQAFTGPDGELLREPVRSTNDSAIALRRLNASSETHSLKALLQAEHSQAFDLHGGPLVRAALFELGYRQYVLSVTIHHITVDGPSFGLFWQDLQRAYNARSGGGVLEWNPPARAYADFVNLQRQQLRGESAKRQFDYWREQLQGLPPAIPLPAGQEVLAEASLDSWSLTFEVPADAVAAIATFAQRKNCSPFIAYLTMFAVALRQQTGESDFAIGTPVSLRPQADFDEVVGFFANTMPLRMRFHGIETLDDALGYVRARCLGLYENCDVPFERLVQELNPARVQGRNAVFQTIFSYETDDVDLQLNGVSASAMPLDTYTAKLDLEMAVHVSEGRVLCHLMSRPGAFDAKALGSMRQTILEAIYAAAQPNGSLHAIGAAHAATHGDLVDARDADAAREPSLDLFSLFARSAETYADNVALDSPALRLTYGQLADRVTRAAQALGSMGVRQGDRVGIVAGHHPHNVTAMLAIARIGAAFVPIDPEHTLQWNRHITNDAGLKALVCHAGSVGSAGELGLPIVDLDAVSTSGQGEQRALPPHSALPDSCAYVIYTSGSTGLPKGVAVSHRSVCHNVLSMTQIMGVSSQSRIAQYVSPVFDVVLGEVFPALAGGAAIVFGDRRKLLPGPALIEWLADQRVTHWWIVPSALAMVPEAELPALEVIIVAGEACPREVAQRWAKNRRLLNGYGPTEAAIVVSLTDYHAERERLILRPMGVAELHVLDDDLQPADVGVAGELFIGGACVALGYLGQPARTAGVFIADPFAGTSAARLYRTGDVVRRLDDGAIQFIGRVDRQVKIRGFRIELDAVRAALVEVPGVQAAEALVLPDAQGQPHLVGYVVASCTRLELLDGLRRKVPEAMVPSSLVFLDALPTGSTGKTDLKALKALKTKVAASEPAAEQAPMPQVAVPRTLQRVREVWKALLERDDIGDDENFFDAGGHSLRAVVLHQQLTQLFGDDVALTDVFEYPTIAALASRLDVLLKRRGDTAANDEQAAADAGIDPDAIAIIGMDGVFPEAPDLDQFWQRLLSGYEAGRTLTEAELDAHGVPADLYNHPHFVRRHKELAGKADFDAGFFGYSPREAQVMDPQQRIFLELAWQVLERAGYGDQGRVRSVGVFAGAAFSYYLLQNVMPNAERLRLEPGQWLIGNDKDFIATRTAYKLNLQGPAISVGTACSSSLMAVHLACASLRNGEAEMALAGAVALDPDQVGYLYSEGGIMSPDGRCRPFDASAAGTAGGSGGGVVLLKKLSAARRDGDSIYAVIKGSAANNDGAAKVSYTAPSVTGQASVIRDALRAAKVSAASIGYVEAHGTGTPLGDPIEVRALAQAFADDPASGAKPQGYCGIGSIKGNIGHLDAAAGIAGLIKTVLALHHEVIPPSINCDTPNAQIGFDKTPFSVVQTARAWPRTAAPRRAGISSFGIGGTNVHVVLEEAPPVPGASDDEPSRWQLLPVSGRSKSAVERQWLRLRDGLSGKRLQDAAYTLQLGRTAFEHRSFTVVDGVGDVQGQLRSVGSLPAFERRHAPSVVFMFPGQGSQYPGMGAALYGKPGVFKDEVDRCALLLQRHIDEDIRTLMFGSDAAKLKETRYAQPALFTIEYALAKQLQEWGIVPKAMIGHSVGELVAAAVSDMVSLPDAIALVAIRASAMQQQPGGAMLAVSANPDELSELTGAGCEIAAINGPEQYVLAGTIDQIMALEDRCIAAGIACQRLATSHAFHTSLMAGAEQPVNRASDRIARRAGSVPIVSNRSGRWLNQQDLADPSYWGDHLRKPVQFHAGIGTLLDAFDRPIFVEVGPGRALSSLLNAASANEARDIVTTLPHARENKNDNAALLQGVGTLWALGADVDWTRMHAPGSARRIELPTYPFERKRFWIDAPKNGARSTPTALQGDAAEAADGLAMRQEAGDEAGRSAVSFDLHERLWFVDEHRIFDGAPVLPGSACLELVRRALAVKRPGLAVSLREVYFPSALVLSEGEVRRTRVVFDSNKNRTDFVLESMDGDGHWLAHATGRVEDAVASPETPLSPLALRERLRLSEVSDAGGRFAQVFAEYGPRWQSVDAVWLGAGAGLARLRLPVAAHGDLPDFALHPSLLDVATAFLPASLRPRDASVPFRYESIQLHQPLRAECYSLAVETAPNVFDVTLFAWDDASQRADVLVAIRGFGRRELSGRVRDVSPWCRTVKWGEAPLGRPLPPERWLVFGEAYMAIAPAGSVRVRPDETFRVLDEGHYGVRPDSKADYEQLMARLAENDDSPTHLVYGWDATAETDVSVAFTRLMTLMQALGARRREWRVSLITHGVRASRTLEASVGAALLGALKAVRWEYPHVVCRHIDLDDTSDGTMAMLRAELSSEPVAVPNAPPEVPSSVSLIDGRRDMAGYVPLDAASRTAALRDGGVYLITGGATGIGLELALHIAERCQAVRLVLLSRSAHDENAARFSALDAAGASVLRLNVDVADAGQFADAVQTARARFGRIDGVIHAAGVEASGLIETGSPDAWRRVLAAKAIGTQHLFDQFAEASPDFVLLCSSLTAVVGGLGQADYAAANGYMDALARYWRQKGVPVTAVNWDTWAETGMAVRHAERSRHSSERGAALRGLSSNEGRAIFDLALSQDLPQIVVSKAGFGDRTAAKRHPHANDAATASGSAQQAIVALWRELLGVEQIGEDDDFFDLGGHSLLATQMISRVRDLYSRCPTLGEFLEEPTIARILRSLEEHAAEATLVDETVRYCLVPMRTGGTQAPFFCIPGMGGNITQLLPFANALDADRPVIGLQYLGFDGANDPHTSVEQIAAHYVKCMQSVQPEGPYYLGGHSLGGKIAYEIARQLHATGNRVGLVAMLDSASPPYSFVPHQDDFAIASMILGVFAYYFGKNEMMSGIDVDALRAAPRERLLAFLSERLAEFGLIQSKNDTSAIRGLFNVYRAAADFSPLYHPPHEHLPIPILLFKAMDSMPDGISLPEIRETPAWGWENFTNLPVQSLEVRGNHYSCLMNEHVGEIASALREELRKAAPGKAGA